MKVLWALHPDNQSETKTAEAFIIMRRMKRILCDAGPISSQKPAIARRAGAEDGASWLTPGPVSARTAATA